MEAWHAIGHKLVPKEVIWNSILAEPGMASVSVMGKHSDDKPGRTIVRIEPSVKYRPAGVYININDHSDVVEGPNISSKASKLIDVLQAEWKSSTENSKKIFEKIKNDL